MFPKPQKTEKQVKEKHVFRTDVMLGENLKSYVQTVANYKKRSLYKNIMFTETFATEFLFFTD